MADMGICRIFSWLVLPYKPWASSYRQRQVACFAGRIERASNSAFLYASAIQAQAFILPQLVHHHILPDHRSVFFNLLEFAFHHISLLLLMILNLSFSSPFA